MARGDEGLTLIEMMVTLAIIAIISGIAVLGIGSANRGATVQAEAQRLAGRLRLAADEVLVTRRSLALAADRDSYGFVSRDAATGRWAPDKVGLLGERHRAPAAVQYVMPSTAPIALEPDGLGEPFVVVVSGRKDSWTVTYDGLNVVAAPAPGAS
ncbi:MAG: type II secretion system protein GspH [Brevundimonas sp.]|nr:MAG: type II secretion system protein GspH [Brevundimonas sp.]